MTSGLIEYPVVGLVIQEEAEGLNTHVPGRDPAWIRYLITTFVP